MKRKNSKSDESCISNPEIRNFKLDGAHETGQSNLRFRISGFEMQDSSDFKFFLLCFSLRYSAARATP
jgi:hypothetical protein